MYRAVSILVLEKGVQLNELDKILEILENIKIEFKGNLIFLNNEDVTGKIRSKEVTNLVSPLSAIKQVRYKLIDMQREYSRRDNIVMEGRDIGTEVFPNAEIKIYLDASKEERANRRYEENNSKGIECTYEEILEHILERDNRDSNREMGALRKAEDAVYIDTTKLTIEEVAAKIIVLINNNSNRGNNIC